MQGPATVKEIYLNPKDPEDAICFNTETRTYGFYRIKGED